MGPAPLIADPSRNADRQGEFQIGLQLRPRAGETVRHAAHELRAMLAQDRDKVIVCVALMQEHGLGDAGRELQLPAEGIPLVGARREIAEVVKAAFSDRRHLRLPRKLLELREQLGCQLRRVMRVNAGCCKQPARSGARELDRLTGAGAR